MEKIYFDAQTYVWRTQFDISDIKDDVLKECADIMEEMGDVPGDNFGFFNEWNGNINFDGTFVIETKIHTIIKKGIDVCTTLFNENIKLPFNKVNTDAWVNVVRAKNPKQPNFDTPTEIVMHNHVDLNHINKVKWIDTT
jgi:hypothetical protein